MRIDHTSNVFTAGELLPNGHLVELIRNATGSALAYWNGKRSASRTEIRRGSRLYLPISVPDDVSHAMVLPDGNQHYGSTVGIFRDLCHLFEYFGGQLPRTAAWASFFAIGTWFFGAVPTGSRIEIAGSSTGAARILELLSSVCRHPLLVQVTTKSEILRVPLEVQPTLLVHAADANRPTVRFLRSPASARLLVPSSAGQLVKFTAPIAFYAGGAAVERASAGFRILVSASPLRPGTPVWSERTAQEIARKYQRRLLDYRLRNFRKVSHSAFDAAELTSPLREKVNALGACIVGADELRGQLVKLAAEQDAENRIERANDVHAVIIEAALSFCHEEGSGKVYVGEVTERANVILKARGAKLQLEPEAVGVRLGDCGLSRERLGSRGNGLYLTDKTQERIHDLAHRYDVPSLHTEKKRCGFCAGEEPRKRNA